MNLPECNEEELSMKKKVFIIMLFMVVVMAPMMTFAANAPASQPQLETLTLDQCLTQAYQNSKTLQSADKDVEIARETVRSVESGLWPSVGYSLGASKFDPANAKTGGSDKSLQGSVSITQNLYTGGSLSNSIKVSKLKLDNALEDQRKAKQQLTYDVKSAYYQVWLDAQLVKVQQASYDNLYQHYQQMKTFYQAGTKSRYDLLQAEVNYQKIKPTLIQVENTLAIDKLKLANKIGIDKDRQFTVGDEPSNVKFPEKVEIALQDMLDQAYKSRPELRQTRITNEINKVQTQIDVAGYKPKVNLTGAYNGYNGTDYDFSDLTKYWSLTLEVSGNFFDGFKTPATVAKDKDNEEKALLNESNQRDTVRVDVQSAIQDLNADRETIAYSQANINLTKENLRLTQSRFSAGMSTNMDIMDAELNLDQACNTYYTNVSAYLTAQAKLDLSVGKDN
jgi:outer membrane protein